MDTVGEFKTHKLTDFGLTDFLKPYRIVEFAKAEYNIAKSLIPSRFWRQ